MSIVILGSTSGSITLQEPAVAGTTVLTLPATSGTLITTGSSGQSIPKAALPTGSVLQVVYGSIGTQFTTTSGTAVDIGLSAVITPQFSTSKILVLTSLNGVFVNAVGSAFAYGYLNRNGSNLGQFGYIIGYVDSASFNRSGAASFQYLDSPATTSALTYKIQGAVANGGTVNYQRDSQAISSIVLMEIAG